MINLHLLPNGTTFKELPFNADCNAIFKGTFRWKRLHCYTQKVAHKKERKDLDTLVFK